MSPDSQTFHVDRPHEAFERAARWLLYAMLAFMPLAFGAVDGWSETVAVALVGLIVVATAISRAMRSDPDRRLSFWALTPIALFVVLVLLQLIPWPRAIVEAISPNTARVRSDLLSDLPNASQALGRMTLSFYPLATRHALRIILCAIGIFYATIALFRHSWQIRQLLGVISVIGTSVAILTLMQDVTRAKAIYWIVERDNYLARSGPFINHNNFAQFMNLSIGAALALFFALLGNGQKHLEWTLDTQSGRDSKTITIRWLGVAIVLMCASVFLSQSRGGMVSLVVAGVVIGILVSFSKRMRRVGWIFVPLALAVLIFLMVAGLDAVTTRLSTLREAQAAAGARVQIIKDVWHGLIPKFPILGVGLGTHEFVYPLVSHQTFARLAGHVENEYVQNLEEIGIVGVVLIAAFLCAIGFAWMKSIRHRRKPIQAAAFGLGFGLIAILVGSNSDFGQRLPAITSLTAVTCGLIINLANYSSSQIKSSAFTFPRSLRWATLIAIVAVWGWMLKGATRWALAEHEWAHAQQMDRFMTRQSWQANSSDYIELLQSAKAASEWLPGDVEYRHWLNVYRWYTVVAPDPTTGKPIIDEQSRKWARQIVDDFHAARALCPTFGPPYCVAGQIELFFLNDPRGEAHIRRGYQLAPYSPEACFVAAALDVKQHRADESFDKAKQASVLGQNIDSLLDLYLISSDRPDLAMRLVDGNMYGLLRLSDRLDADKRHPTEATAAREQAIALITKRANEPDAPADVLALMAQFTAKQNDYAAAAEWYARAISLDYARVDWHIARARALSAIGRNEEASREAQICLRFHPQMAEARKLIDDMSIKSSTKPQ